MSTPCSRRDKAGWTCEHYRTAPPLSQPASLPQAERLGAQPMPRRGLPHVSTMRYSASGPFTHTRSTVSLSTHYTPG